MHRKDNEFIVPIIIFYYLVYYILDPYTKHECCFSSFLQKSFILIYKQTQ